MQAIERKLFGSPLSEFVESISYSRRAECVWKLITSDYADAELSLERAARVCGISKSHLNVLLQEKTDMSFHRLLTRYRLVRAAQMICEKDYTFLEVTLETGFDNLANFGRHTRKLLGMSPRDLRRHLIQKTPLDEAPSM